MADDVLSLLPGIPLVESPLFETLADAGAFPPDEVATARQLHERGFAVIDFPDPDIVARIERITTWLGSRFELDLANPAVVATAGDLRLQDGWQDNEDIRAIAANTQILAILKRLYGRAAFPFQTLNFPVGTQQHPHSDSVHFSSLPERFMCGVWVAFEDVRVEAGPLEYYPGSHKWPIATNALIGRRGGSSTPASAQFPFEPVWRAMIEAGASSPERFLARKGQALIWAANLLHGGCVREDRSLTRWSQVTHYYFDDCIYYTPAFSDELLNRLDLREPTDISTGDVRFPSYLGDPVVSAEPGRRKASLRNLGRVIRGALRRNRSR